MVMMRSEGPYARWRREDRAHADFVRRVRELERDVESLRLDMEAAWAGGDLAVARSLAESARYGRTVDAFLDLRGYSKDMAGWRAACGTDVGLFRRTRALGWPRLWRVLLKSRAMRWEDEKGKRRGLGMGR